MMREASTFLGVVAPIFILLLVNNANALPIQYLPEVPGYIPVYIRYGDQPLEEINPMLAEAFHESSGISKSIGENRLDDSTPEKNKDIMEENDALLKANKKDTTKDSPAQVIPLKQLISALSQEKKSTPESEYLVSKLNDYLPLENIEVKIIMDDQTK